MAIDAAWALEQLHLYLDLHSRVPLPKAEQTPNRKTRVKGTDAELAEVQIVARRIAEVLWVEAPRWINNREVREMIFELTKGDEVRSHLGLNEPPPTIEAPQLHAWVWDAAEPHWESGNHRAALWAAGVNVNSRLQEKVQRRDVGEGKLLQECFSELPPTARAPRLRLTRTSNADHFKDVHVGAMNLGVGLYAAVRNPVNHIDEREHDIGAPEALESLAAFGLLARWIDRAEVDFFEADA